MDIPIIYQDDDTIVINKPSGISVHGGGSVKGETVAGLLVTKFPELATVGDEPELRPGIVHRLDKETSGVMVLARTQKSFLTLKELFKSRRVQKTYRAICCGEFLPREREGIINAAIGRMIRNPTKRAVARGNIQISGPRDALTEYRVLQAGGNFSLVELYPKTGRMHQLRVHLASIGHPIACDRVYGNANVCCPPGAYRILLHAQSISFSITPGHAQSFEADPPEDFELVLKRFL